MKMYLVQYERQLYRTGKSGSHTPIIVPEGLAVWGQSGVLKSQPPLLNIYFQCDEEYDPILDDPLSTSVAPGAASLFNRNLREITILKPGSHMPPMYLWSSRWYHLGYFSDEWERAPPATRAELYRRRALPSACLRSWTRVNFAAMPGVKTEMSNVAGHFCSHIGTVSQAELAATSQVHQRHMRTRLYIWTEAKSGIVFVSVQGYPVYCPKTTYHIIPWLQFNVTKDWLG